MASRTERVSFPGIIRGEEYEASCTVRRRKSRIQTASTQLIWIIRLRTYPRRHQGEGNYEVTAGARKHPGAFPQATIAVGGLKRSAFVWPSMGAASRHNFMSKAKVFLGEERWHPGSPFHAPLRQRRTTAT